MRQMRTRTISAVFLVPFVAALGACSSDTPDDGHTDSISMQPSSVSPSPAVPKTVQKAVGEEGGAYCLNKENSSCLASFTVTSIENVPRSQCIDIAPPPVDTRLVRVAIDVQGNRPLPSPNSHIAPGYVVSSDNWYGLTPDGYTTKAGVATGCGEFTPDPFYQPVNVGQKQRGDIIFYLPEDTEKLQLRDDDGAAWEWPLPPNS